MAGAVSIALDDDTVPGYLRDLGIIGSADQVVVEAAGDGNINWVRRARCIQSGESWIVKQARPALERFPEYRTSTERIVFEHRYFAIARELDRRRVVPRVVHFDAERRVLVLEDFGDAERLDHALARGSDVQTALCAVAGLLGAVHGATSDPGLAAEFCNQEMCRLHGEHIFHLPFTANDFPLEPTLRERAESVWLDRELGAIAARAYERYREPWGALVHGDVQAGNVLLPRRGAVLLDAEIAHVGDPAFDLGLLLAHVVLPGLARADSTTAADLTQATWRAYVEARNGESIPSFADVARYAGIEVMRRTIGAARVAAVRDTGTALAAVDLAARLMRRPPETVEAFGAALVDFAT